MNPPPNPTIDTDDAADELRCLECGTLLFYSGTGRYPHYCSSSCRHRGWERRRAAKDGLVATKVAPNPASRPLRITHSSVVDWLSGHPRRLAKVLTELPADTTTAEALEQALTRLRDKGVQTTQQATAAALRREFAEYRHTAIRRDREQTERLAILERDNATLHTQLTRTQRHTETPEARHASQVGTAVPKGHTSVKMGGKTFHAPAGLSRQQARKWCRDNPGKAID